MEEASNNYEQIDTEMPVAPAPATINKNIQASMPKSIVLDLGQFDSDRTKFKDWWREIQLFLKNNKITVILACLREGVAEVYAQKKLDKLDKKLGTQNWKDFIKEIKTTFSNKIKIADAKQRIESFK